MEIKNPLFDELCSIMEEVDTDFDREKAENVDILTKCFILSVQKTKDGEKIKNIYLNCVCQRQEEIIKKEIEEKGYKMLEYELKKLNFEKEILEKRIEVTRKHLN